MALLDSHLATFDIKTLMRNVKEEEEEVRRFIFIIYPWTPILLVYDALS